jgi:hypothetical protein
VDQNWGGGAEHGGNSNNKYTRVLGSIGISDFISIVLLLLGIHFHHSDDEQAATHPTSM